MRYLVYLIFGLLLFVGPLCAQDFLTCKTSATSSSIKGYETEFKAALHRIGGDDLSASFGYIPHIRVLNSEFPNAFSQADGTILISSGLIDLTVNQAELSFVLAHEISHKLLGHTQSSQAFLGTQELLNSLKERELAADKLALNLLKTAGLPSYAALAILRRAEDTLARRKAVGDLQVDGLEGRIQALVPIPR